MWQIFTFMRMGGAVERIDIKLIAHGLQDETQARQLLERQFEGFDAARAECYKEEDKQKLLGVIEASFGNFKVFNLNVSEVFSERGYGSISVGRSSRSTLEELGLERSLELTCITPELEHRVSGDV